jgi:hypothetical protein
MPRGVWPIGSFFHREASRSIHALCGDTSDPQKVPWVTRDEVIYLDLKAICGATASPKYHSEGVGSVIVNHLGGVASL